jgi:hypothetical protein
LNFGGLRDNQGPMQQTPFFGNFRQFSAKNYRLPWKRMLLSLFSPLFYIGIHVKKLANLFKNNVFNIFSINGCNLSQNRPFSAINIQTL